jgi:hypothetical protein
MAKLGRRAYIMATGEAQRQFRGFGRGRDVVQCEARDEEGGGRAGNKGDER